ncbi:MAG: NADH-quinone oxidoreductase subunit J [Candidatus Thorarchaeota archaeon]|nr:NADH-quinone oxidoreductase subunit J [Candidatus Thorarchaeota archaeon]
MQGFEGAFEQVEFLLIAGIVLVLAYLALEHKEIVYAAFFFGFMASFVAGFFLLLEAPFIAGMQIAVYTGGISALIIFAVLLLPRAQDSSLETFASKRKRRIGLMVAAIVAALSGILALLFPWAESFDETFVIISNDLNELALWLWANNGIYVQMIALIMVTSLVGAIALLKMDKAEQIGSIRGDFGIEAEPTIEEDESPVDEEPPAEEPEEVDA